MTVITILQFSPVLAYFYCGWVESPIAHFSFFLFFNLRVVVVVRGLRLCMHAFMHIWQEDGLTKYFFLILFVLYNFKNYFMDWSRFLSALLNMYLMILNRFCPALLPPHPFLLYPCFSRLIHCSAPQHIIPIIVHFCPIFLNPYLLHPLPTWSKEFKFKDTLSVYRLKFTRVLFQKFVSFPFGNLHLSKG